MTHIVEVSVSENGLWGNMVSGSGTNRPGIGEDSRRAGRGDATGFNGRSQAEGEVRLRESEERPHLQDDGALPASPEAVPEGRRQQPGTRAGDGKHPAEELQAQGGNDRPSPPR